MADSQKLVKPLKPAPQKWSKKERLMVLALFFLTLLVITLFWLKGRDFNSPQLAQPKVNIPKIVPESKVVFEIASPTPSPSSSPKDQLQLLTQNLQGTYGLYVYNLKSQTQYGLHDQEVFPAASLIKLPLLIALYQTAEKSQLNLDELYTLRDADKVEGAGSLQYSKAGTQISFRNLAKLMAKSSDNTAARIVATRLGNDKINSTISQIGMLHTSYKDTTTTPTDTGLLLQKLYQGQLLSSNHTEELLNFLTNTDWEELIPTGIPPGIRVTHKYASDVGTWSDAGIVYADSPFILVIASSDAIQSEAFDTIPQITKIVYQHETN